MKILAFAGSLRKASHNRALVRAAIELAPDGMEIKPFDLIDIPLFNQDVEAQGDPPAVIAFRDAIRSADGLLIAVPEYNHGVPGVLKNAIDWASRPPRGSALSGKPIGLMGATLGTTGTARAQSMLRQSFVFTNSYVMPQPEVLVSRVQDRVDDNGNLVDEKTREHLAGFLIALGDWIERVKS